MESAMPYIVAVGILAGAASVIQASLAGVITEQLGVLENALIVFGGGFFFSLILILLNHGGKISAWKSLPWYSFVVGPLGVVIIGSVGFAIPRIGLAGTITLIVVSQLIISVVFDHFGWMSPVHPVDIQRIIGIALLMIGTWIVLR